MNRIAVTNVSCAIIQIYMPLRAQERETCHGSSDNIVVPIDEFRSTMDGAIRIAR